MKNKKSTHKFSKILLIIWGLLLIVVILILVWTAITPAVVKEPKDQKTSAIDIKIPEGHELDKHILKDDPIKIKNDTASLKDIPSEIIPNPPYKVYAAKGNQDIEGKTKIAFIFTDLGTNEDSLNQIMEGTPSEVSLSFLPFAKNIKEDMGKARAQGREVLLCTPMEPSDYPQTDPGPHTLLTGLPEKDNIERLETVLSKGQEYIGLVNYRGSLFLSSSRDLIPVLEEVDKRGLAFIEAVSNFRSKADVIASEIKMPYLRSHFVIHEDLTPRQLSSLLIQIEQMAEKVPLTVVVAHTSPQTVPFLVSWIQKAKDSKFAFLPITQALQFLSPTYEASREMATKT